MDITSAPKPAEPKVSQQNDVVILQLPFNFENLFTQPIPRRDQQQPTAVAISKRPSSESSPRKKRLKLRKMPLQHLEELNCEHLRLAENGLDIFCTPCNTSLSENGKIKKSTVKLHLTCKRHLFNVKALEAKTVPPEIKKDSTTNLYMCSLCGKAIANDTREIRRHCQGKKHTELLQKSNRQKMESAARRSEETEIPALKSASTPVTTTKRSARELNREFIDDVLNYLVNTNSTFSSVALKHLGQLLDKWTTMRLPDPDTLRKNHVPRFLQQNPALKDKFDTVAAKRAARKTLQTVVSSGDSVDISQHEEESEPAISGLEQVIQDEHPGEEEMQTETVTVTELELAEAIQALAANAQNPIFSVGDLANAIKRDFGSFDNFKTQLSNKAVGVQGSGWGWLGFDPQQGRLQIAQCANQDPLEPTMGLIPLLGIDVWEHAYYLDYKNVRADYVKKIWEVINWEDVAERYHNAASKKK